MKIYIGILSVIVISLFSCTKEIKAKAINPTAFTIDNKKTFVPFAWQTKWFYRDLNSRLKLSGKEGC